MAEARTHHFAHILLQGFRLAGGDGEIRFEVEDPVVTWRWIEILDEDTGDESNDGTAQVRTGEFDPSSKLPTYEVARRANLERARHAYAGEPEETNGAILKGNIQAEADSVDVDILWAHINGQQILVNLVGGRGQDAKLWIWQV